MSACGVSHSVSESVREQSDPAFPSMHYNFLTDTPEHNPEMYMSD